MSLIKHALRFILRDKYHTALNVIGLALGLICSIVIFLYAKNELGYDKHYENSELVYRIGTNVVSSGRDTKFAVLSPSFGDKLLKEYPSIESYTRIYDLNNVLLQFENKQFYEDNVFIADTNYFDLFNAEFIYGDAKTCLQDPLAIVLTESISKKYFGDRNPMGELIKVNLKTDYKVAGVIKDLPDNIHVKPTIFLSWLNFEDQINSLQWSLFEILGYTYVRVSEHFTFDEFYEKWPEFYEKYAAEDAVRYGQVLKPVWQKLHDIHYDKAEDLRGDFPKGNKTNLVVIVSIGVLIMLLSCINFINMATAQYGRRLKEIGAKKIIGASRQRLIRQFLLESYVFVFIAIDIALVAVELIFSHSNFNALLSTHLELRLLSDHVLIMFLLIIFISMGLIAGLYPAFYLSGVSPLENIQGEMQKGKSGRFVRNLLVSVQFVITITVIILTLFMHHQLNYMKSFDKGFDSSSMMVVRVRDTVVGNHMPAVKAELLSSPYVEKVSTSSNMPGIVSSGLYRFEGEDGMEEHNFSGLFVADNFIQTFDIAIVEGRNFILNSEKDRTESVLVNQKLADFMGWENPIGKQMHQMNRFKARVVGVVEDFNYTSLHSEIAPMWIRLQNGDGNKIVIKLKGDTKLGLAEVENIWKKLNPNRPFTYNFIQDNFEEMYNNDDNQNSLIRLFSFICLVISLIGLFGLTSYTAISRTKEVGIRKALGSSTFTIIFMLFKNILILIAISFVISIPLSIYIIRLWLDNFAFKAMIGPEIFIVALVTTSLVAIFTAAFHTLRVAMSNPVNSLRYE